jgi:hypothetical protein
MPKKCFGISELMLLGMTSTLQKASLDMAVVGTGESCADAVGRIDPGEIRQSGA